MTPDRIAIVGAGLAGLSCAHALGAHGLPVALFDKGRGPGGRASTRRLVVAGRERGFDHGAQYLTARDPAFRAEVARWRGLGLVAPWPAAGADALVGTPGMNAPIRHLAADQAVAWGARVDELRAGPDGWRLRLADGERGPFAAVVLAVPAEQAAVLAAEAAPALAALAAGRPSDPCWTVLLALAGRVPVEADLLRSDGALAWAARDSAKPGRAAGEAWVLQASPAWSRDHLEEDGAAVIPALVALFAAAVGAPLPARLAEQAHRWRYARSARGDDGCWWDGGRRLGACGDWLLGPRLEAAWVSGRRLGEAIAADRR